MQKKFLTNLFLLLFINLLVKPIWIFGIDRSIQNITGPEDYGWYFTLFNYSFIFNILLDFGINNYNNRVVSRGEVENSDYFSKLLSVKLMLSLIYFGANIFFAWMLGYMNGADLHLLFLLLLNQFFVSFILYSRSIVSGNHAFKTDSFISVFDKILMIVFGALLIHQHNQGSEIKIDDFIYIQSISYGIAAIVSFLLSLKYTSKIKLTIDTEFGKRIIKESFPYALLILLMSIYTRIDVVMIERILPAGKYFSGVYAQGFRIMDAFSMAGFLFASLLLPVFSKMIKTKDSIDDVLKHAESLLMTGMVILAFSCFAFRDEIISLLYTDVNEQSAVTFGVLMFCLIPLSMTYIYGTLLTANGSLRFLNTMALLGVVINIMLNAVLIPKHLAFGAAVASLITQFFTMLIQFGYAHKTFQIKMNYSLYFKILILIFWILCFKNVVQFLPVEMDWMAQFGLLLASSLLLSLFAKSIAWKEIISLLKQEN